MKAILEVEFDLDEMISDEDLQKYHNGNVLEMMQYLWKEECMGIFSEEIKLTRIEDDE